MTRQLVVVDCETSSLANPVALEVAAVNVDTGDELVFVPHVSSQTLAMADPVALQINRYFERGVFNHMCVSPEATKVAFAELGKMLLGNTFAGSNPAFDAAVIHKYTEAVWHHRLADLSAYAAGRLGIDPGELPGLNAVCDLLGVVNTDPHSALGDARATAECFRRLRAIDTNPRRVLLGLNACDCSGALANLDGEQ